MVHHQHHQHHYRVDRCTSRTTDRCIPETTRHSALRWFYRPGTGGRPPWYAGGGGAGLLGLAVMTGSGPPGWPAQRDLPNGLLEADERGQTGQGRGRGVRRGSGRLKNAQQHRDAREQQDHGPRVHGTAAMQRGAEDGQRRHQPGAVHQHRPPGHHAVGGLGDGRQTQGFVGRHSAEEAHGGGNDRPQRGRRQAGEAQWADLCSTAGSATRTASASGRDRDPMRAVLRWPGRRGLRGTRVFVEVGWLLPLFRSLEQGGQFRCGVPVGARRCQGPGVRISRVRADVPVCVGGELRGM